MHVVKLLKVDKTMIVTLPASIVEALHWQENEHITVEAVGDRIILTRPGPDFQDVWSMYEDLKGRYSKANRKLAE